MQPYIDLCTPTWRPLEDNIRSFTGFSCSCNGSIFDKLYPRASLPISLRPIACFTLEIARFVCDLTTCIYAYSVSAYHACTGNQLISTWVEPSEMNAMVELCHR